MFGITERIEELGVRPITGRERSPGVVVAARTPLMRLALASYLTREGFAVWAAGTGAGAVGECLRHSGEVDVLLAEADLPDLPAASLYAHARECLPDLRCYFIARPGDVGAGVARAMGAGMVSWPASLDRLAGVLWAEALDHMIEDA